MHSLVEISEKEIIASAKMKLRITNTTEHDDFLSVYVQEGARQMNCYSLYRKRQCTLTIENGQAQLPKGFLRLLGLRFKGASLGTGGVSNCYTYLYSDVKFLETCGCSQFPSFFQNYWQSMQIVRDKIHFNTPNDVHKAELAFMGTNVDENGDMIFYDYYERALRAYLCYQFTQAYFEQYNQYIIEQYAAEWKAQKTYVRGLDKVYDFQNTKREVQNAFNAMCTSRLVNF